MDNITSKMLVTSNPLLPNLSLYSEHFSPYCGVRSEKAWNFDECNGRAAEHESFSCSPLNLWPLIFSLLRLKSVEGNKAKGSIFMHYLSPTSLGSGMCGGVMGAESSVQFDLGLIVMARNYS